MATSLCPHWADSTTRSPRESEPSSSIRSRSSSTRTWAAITVTHAATMKLSRSCVKPWKWMLAFTSRMSFFGQALDAKGARDAAIVECQKARALNDDPSVLGALGRAYGLSGNKMEAEKILDQLKKLSKERYVAAYSFALVYLGLGDKEQALRWLEQSYQDRAGSDIGFIRVDPLLDPLRGDPRFEALAAKIVPAAEFKSATASK